MKYSLLILVAILPLLFGFTSSSDGQFWSWFAKNEDRLYHFDAKKPGQYEPLFDDIALQLHKLNSHLTFEFGPLVKGKREFIISANGIREAFPDVESLVANAPKLKRWKIIAFRPRMPKLMTIKVAGIVVDPKSVYVKLFRYQNKIGIALFMPGYIHTKRNAYEQAGFLLLDQAIGEFDVETQVGTILFRPLGTVVPDNSIPSTKLAKIFDSVYARYK